MLAASVAVPAGAASSACGVELAASASGLCGGRFASRNELFRHLRGASACAAAGRATEAAIMSILGSGCPTFRSV